jgi:hypothetical protein
MFKLKDITGFVTCMYDNFWWLGCVLSVSEELNDMKISFLYPHGPSASYMYPAMPHILWLSQSSILAKVSPNVPSQVNCASSVNKMYLQRWWCAAIDWQN